MPFIGPQRYGCDASLFHINTYKARFPHTVDAYSGFRFPMDSRPKILKSPLQELVLLGTVCLGQFLSQGSISMSLSTMNIIQEYFEEKGSGLNSQKVWYMGSYALTLGSFILVSGRLGDLFGLRKIFVFGWFWAALWSLVTGLSYFSESSILFIICRAFQGIGFALIIPCGVGILGTTYPNGKRKNFAFAFFASAAPVGASLSCLMSGMLAQLARWDWAFYCLAIACAILGSLSIYAIPGPFRHHNYTLKEAFARFDTWGALLGVAGLVILNFVWNHGPVVGWLTPYIIVLLVLSVVLLALFFSYELLFASVPLLPRSVFNLRIGLVLACMSLGWGLFGVWQYYYWSFMMGFRHYTPVETALTYMPLLILGVVAALIVGHFMSKRTAPYIIFASMCGFLGGCLFLEFLPVHQSFWHLSFAQMFLLPWGMDCSFPAASLILSDFLPEEHQGMAGSLVNTVVNYSVSFFLAVASTVEIEVHKRNNDVLSSYRSAVYLGVGIAGLAVLVAVVFIFVEHGEHKKIEESD